MPDVLFTLCLCWLAVVANIISHDLVTKTRRDMRRQRIFQQLDTEVNHAA